MPYKEHTAPERTLTTTVHIEGSVLPLLPVRTDKPIPKELLLEAMQKTADIIVKAPVKWASDRRNPPRNRGQSSGQPGSIRAAHAALNLALLAKLVEESLQFVGHVRQRLCGGCSFTGHPLQSAA